MVDKSKNDTQLTSKDVYVKILDELVANLSNTTISRLGYVDRELVLKNLQNHFPDLNFTWSKVDPYKILISWEPPIYITVNVKLSSDETI